MKRALYIFFFGLAFISCSLEKEEGVNISVDNRVEFELINDYEGISGVYHRQHLINYFVSIALGSEFGQDFPISRKWNKPMQLFVDGKIDSLLQFELISIIDELNLLFTDGFEIQTVRNREEANFYLFFGEQHDYISAYHPSQPLEQNTHGYFDLSVSSDFEILSGHLFVNIGNVTTHGLRKHILREELTQSLGLSNDIPYYPNSIFYEGFSSVSSYSDIDIEVIRLLYHPRMIIGLNEDSIRSLLSDILGLKL